MKPTISSSRGIMKWGIALTVLGLVAMAGIYLVALGYTPLEVRQGAAQKIFYVHVPAAWNAMVAFTLVGLVSILYLWLRDERLDTFAASSAEVGLVFSVIMLTTGPIWGKPIWGTWWTWDARLTLTLILFLLFVGYMTLRSAVHDPAERARFAAVVGIMGMVLVPFIHLSVYLFRTLHPMPIVLKPSSPSLPPEMLRTLLLGFLAATVLYVGFVVLRYGLARHAMAQLDEES
ncbi:MAG: cytochrome c biogenesis protein CcsA [Gemmatimonadetes bacterium]|nr:cytochrome c biogenesis protein CcsA [Gemmatimonadota bacterium]